VQLIKLSMTIHCWGLQCRPIGYFNGRGWEFRVSTWNRKYGALKVVEYNFVAWEQQIIMLKTGSKLIEKWRRYKCLKIAQSVYMKV